MAEAIKIEIFRQKDADALSAALADPAGRLDAGGGAAMTAALSAALLKRAAAVTAERLPENDRAAYILRNAEILRGYMVRLIDEDVKSRAPLRRAMKEGGEREIEAARHPASAIPAEIVNMMLQQLALTRELCDLCPRESLHWLGESAELSMAAIRTARLAILNMSERCSDDTYRFIVRRENEISLDSAAELAAEILAAAEAAVSSC